MRIALKAVGLALALVPLAAIAEDPQDNWARGEDPVSARSGLHSGDVYVTCSGGTGMIFVSTPAADGHAPVIKGGSATAVSHEHKAEGGRAQEWTEAADPAWQAALADGALTVGGARHAFVTERDKRYFGLFLRICAKH